MTKRTRISKKAQSRRRRDFELGALFRMKFNTFYGEGYWYVAGHSGQRLGLDITNVPALDIYIAKTLPVGSPAFPAKPIDELLIKAVYQIHGQPRSFSEKLEAVRIHTKMVLMWAESGLVVHGVER